MRPRASVLMPAFNAEATILESVSSVLAQTEENLELLVIDDGSATPVAEVMAPIDDPRVRVLRHSRNVGAARARNTGLAAAGAPVVCQLDADDLWEPHFLERMLPELDEEGVALAYSNVRIIGHPEGHEDYIGDTSIHPRDRFPELAEANPVPCPTAVMKTDAVRAVGGYTAWLRSVEEWHLYLRLAAAGWRFVYHDEQLASYRWPTAERGMSFDTRLMDRWAIIALLDIAVRHPRLKGPKSEIVKRLRRYVSGS